MAQAPRFNVGVRVCFNDIKVPVATPRESASLEPFMVRIPLKPGWNPLLISIDRLTGDDDRGDFEIQSPPPIEARAGK